MRVLKRSYLEFLAILGRETGDGFSFYIIMYILCFTL